MLLPWLLAVMCLSPSSHSETLWHTRAEIELQPEKGHISWMVELSPAGAEAPGVLKEALEFDLHSGLEVDPPEFGTLTRVSEGPRDHDPGIDPRPEITRNRWL